MHRTITLNNRYDAQKKLQQQTVLGSVLKKTYLYDLIYMSSISVSDSL